MPFKLFLWTLINAIEYLVWINYQNFSLGVVPTCFLFTNYYQLPFAKSCGNKPGKTKLGRDVGHDRNSRPSIVFTFIRDDFLTNQNTYATKTLRRNCDWRWPELLPATDTHFKGQRYRLPTFTEVEPDVLAVSQPNKDLGQLPALQLLFSCKFVLRVQPHTVIIRLKAICLLRLLIVLPSTPQIPPISFALHPLTVMMVPQLRLQCRTPP